MRTVVTMSALDTDYVRARVSALENGGAVNPGADPVTMAFKSDGTAPSVGDWKTASWDTTTTTDPDIYRAQCLIGPNGGTITLTAGEYRVWVKIVDSPETPVKRADFVLVIF